MAKRGLDEIGPWSEVKLDIIREYASTYTKILAKKSIIQKYIYIDAFAGAGQHTAKDSGRMIKGSPLNALEVEPPFHEYHFIDLDESRVTRLEKLRDNREDVFVYHGDCNEVLLKEVLPRSRYEDYARSLCLLDPYKLAVNWDVLETAGKMKSIEVFYNFMIMDANMNVLWSNPGNVPREQVVRMNAVWGDESWWDAAYSKEQKSLFPEIDTSIKQPNESLAKAFKERLHKVAGFNYVPDPIAMKNSTGATVYYLFFASPNKDGAKIVGDIFNKYRKQQNG